MWAAQSCCGYLFASDTIRKGDNYRTPVIPAVPALLLSRDQEPESSDRTPVIPAALLSRNPADFRKLSRMTQLLQIAKGSNLTVLAGFKTLDSGSETLPE
jgi:hypothetical protein